jgi:transcriptional regulator with XRE-family HTH domain
MIKKARETIGMSQTELGKRVGLSHAGISLLERGRRRTTMDVFLALCRELDLNPDELLKPLGKQRTKRRRRNV